MNVSSSRSTTLQKLTIMGPVNKITYCIKRVAILNAPGNCLLIWTFSHLNENKRITHQSLATIFLRCLIVHFYKSYPLLQFSPRINETKRVRKGSVCGPTFDFVTTRRLDMLTEESHRTSMIHRSRKMEISDNIISSLYDLQSVCKIIFTFTWKHVHMYIDAVSISGFHLQLYTHILSTSVDR